MNYFSRFWICGSIPEIFAIKVESCQKSRKILDGFLPFQILGGRPSKNCTHVITPGWRHVVWIKICDDIPISPEVIDVHTLNFKPNFKFSRLKFFWGTPSQLGCALGSIGQSLARIKILGHSTPWRPLYSLLKNVHLGGSICTSITLSFVDQSSRSFYSNVGWVVVDQLLFRFSICGSISEIFAIKVESCKKSRKILDGFFAHPNFRGQAIQKLYPRYHPWLAPRRLDKNVWWYPHQSRSYWRAHPEF